MPTTLTLQPTGQQLTVPTKWADVSLQQFIDLFAPMPGDKRVKAELLCGLPAGGLDQLAINDVRFILPLIEFVEDPADVLVLLPTPGLPDVGSLPWGCLTLVQQRFAQHSNRDQLVHLSYLLAVYRSQLTWGDTSRVDAIEAALLASPVTEVYADGAAFLAAWKNWSLATPQTPPTTPSPATKNSRRTPIPRWLNDLGRRLRSTRSRTAT